MGRLGKGPSFTLCGRQGETFSYSKREEGAESTGLRGPLCSGMLSGYGAPCVEDVLVMASG